MKERLIIVSIAVILGLLITTAGYFIYQSTKTIPDTPETAGSEAPAVSTTTNDSATPTPANPSGLLLTIDTPANESIHDKRTIDVKGKTNPGNTVVISSNQEDVIAKPSNTGAFSTTITIDAGTNKIITRVISPSGEQVSDNRIVTYASEDF